MEIQTRILSMEIKNAGNRQNTKAEVGIGDDVTINGVVTKIFTNGTVDVITKSGDKLRVWADDLNTIRPVIKIPEKDERRGK